MGAQERKRQKRIRSYVINRDGMICCYCDMPLVLEDITMEHIVPDSKRGTFNTTNLTVSCSFHNNKRGNKPFFEYCKQFNFSEDKLEKYKRLYFSNLKIKILNISKEECIMNDTVIPNEIIMEACRVLRIKPVDFSNYENQYQFDIQFNQPCHRKKIKVCFEQLIRIIEGESE